MLPLLPQLDKFPDSVAGVQSAPHVSECLLVASADIIVSLLDLAVSAVSLDVALADRAHDCPDCEIAVQREKALEIHVQILANSFRVGIPTTDAIDQL